MCRRYGPRLQIHSSTSRPFAVLSIPLSGLNPAGLSPGNAPERRRVPIIYKICPAALWREAERAGVFRGMPVDHRDGYIHFSGRDQLSETARRHFANQPDLVLIAVDGDRLGPALKWESSRGGALFPHLYGELALSAVVGVTPLNVGTEGHVLTDLAP
jgi:uncharacterized protein (DUF952 family)